MTDTLPPHSDDRVLPYTRWLSLFIVPFLIAAFVILYVFPGRTAELFAWPIKPSTTSRTLASAYLGGAYFFSRVLVERRWVLIKSGFPAVCAFASLLGIATVLHWEKFTHDHVSFWAWAGLYFTAPLLVFAAWLRNRRVAARPLPGQGRLGGVSRAVVLGGAGAGTVIGIVSFVAPGIFTPSWPWALTPLTARVMSAVLCLASAGLVVWWDPRRSCLERMAEVALIMTGLMLLATIIGRAELHADRPLFWPWLLVLSVIFCASCWSVLGRWTSRHGV